ncbi:MAG: hypothetical protein ABJC89_15685 [Acidobacteriota bacterium]
MIAHLRGDKSSAEDLPSNVPLGRRATRCPAAPDRQTAPSGNTLAKRAGEVDVAEVLVEFSEPVSAKDGRHYVARACGSETDTNLWQGWIEFLPGDGGEPVRSGRETTQPNRQDAEYWATGLTPVYLEGALDRALNPLVRKSSSAPAAPSFDGPAPAIAAPPRQRMTRRS